MREQLDRVVAEMVDKGVHYDDAQREFERRFIARVVAACDGNVSRAAEVLGMHRNTLTRKVAALKIRGLAQLRRLTPAAAPPGLTPARGPEYR